MTNNKKSNKSGTNFQSILSKFEQITKPNYQNKQTQNKNSDHPVKTSRVNTRKEIKFPTSKVTKPPRRTQPLPNNVEQKNKSQATQDFVPQQKHRGLRPFKKGENIVFVSQHYNPKLFKGKNKSGKLGLYSFSFFNQLGEEDQTSDRNKKTTSTKINGKKFPQTKKRSKTLAFNKNTQLKNRNKSIDMKNYQGLNHGKNQATKLSTINDQEQNLFQIYPSSRTFTEKNKQITNNTTQKKGKMKQAIKSSEIMKRNF